MILEDVDLPLNISISAIKALQIKSRKIYRCDHKDYEGQSKKAIYIRS